MKALLLAGGFGTRLRPLTYTRPKHLLPVANRAHIDHVLDLLQGADVTDVVLLTSYLAERFEQAIEDARARGISVQLAHEKDPLGTAGALKNAEAFVGDDTFLVFNADVLTDADLGAVVGFHRASSAEATILLTPVEDPSAFGVVPTDANGLVTGFIEKPPPGESPTNLINAGVYVMEPSVLDRIPKGEPWSAERALFPGLVEEGARLFATSTDAYWMDIGTPDKYLQANLDALHGHFTSPSTGTPDENHVLLGLDVLLEDDVRISSSCLGERTEVQSGAEIRGSVLLPGAVVSRRARVESSILGEAVTVLEGARIAGRTIADGEIVGSADD